MHSVLLAFFFGLGALFAACEDTATTRVTPAPSGSPVASDRTPINPGATFVRNTIRVLPSGGYGTAVVLSVELPTTEPAFQQGLMGSPPLPDTQGMLFVMAKKQCAFWMKDTPSPLSIGFIGPDGRIFDIRDMQPLSLEIHDPGRPCTYALEVSQGWFARHGIRAGDRVDFPWPADQPPPYPAG